MANYRQFDPVPLVCPHCNTIIGEVAYFESFEYKVAGWLNGEVAPNSTPGFDVWRCKAFPRLTFQVKYSMSKVFKTKWKKATDEIWAWHVTRPQPTTPDFFILFGIKPDKTEHVFLLSRADYYEKAWTSGAGPDKGARIIRVSAKDKSERKDYNYIPKIRRHEVLNPIDDLIGSIEKYIANPSYRPNAIIRSEATSVFSDAVIPELHKLYASGFNQREIGVIYQRPQSFISRVLRRTKQQYAYIYSPLFSQPPFE